jgi:diadenosine tetraphosphate (Ap4A) HIT family hydrolase
MSCVFCDIVAGDAPASIVFQDERTVTFLDHQPVSTGHMLVVPRRHSPSLAELDVDDGAQLFRVGMHGAAALRASPLPSAGINFYLADGEVAGQEVFHVHLHVIPRRVGDGLGFRHGPDFSVRERAELDETANAIREVWT